MEFNQIESFLAVVKHKSFSKAADELFLTQPTISNNIQKLERELETCLINRTGKDLTLTDSGQLFYKYAVELVTLKEKTKFHICEHNQKIAGKIELLSSSIPEQYVLPYIIRDFKKLHPQVSFLVSRKSSRDINEDIISGRENFGITGYKTSSNALKYIELYEDELVVALANRANLGPSFNQELDLKSILNENFIVRKEGSGTRLFIEKAFSKVNIASNDLKIVSILTSNEMIKKMVELDQGISILPRISLKNELELGLIKAFRLRDINLKRKFYFVYSSYRALPPNVTAFKDFLIQWKGIC